MNKVFLSNYVKISNCTVKPFNNEKKYFSTGNFEDGKYEIITYQNRPSRANQLLKEGQLTLAKMKGTKKITIVTKEMEQNVYSTGFMALNPIDIDSNYLYYLLSNTEFLQEKDSYSFGTTQFAINETRFKNIKINIVRDKIEQKKIAEFLNKKILEINNLIELEKKQISNLKKYKESLIYETVTHGIKGVNQNFYNTNVEWLGEIPFNWNVVRIKNVFVYKNEKTKETELDKVNLLSLYTDKGVIQHKDLSETSGNKAVTVRDYKIVKVNDIIVNIILCWMGAIGISNYEGVTSPAYDVYTPKQNINSKYYHYLFRTKKFCGECFKKGKGIMLMRWRTYSSKFLSINIPLPKMNEQNEIVNFLDNKCLEIDDLINLKNIKINKLEDYKEALIYEYVTGKKRVD